MLAGCGTGIEQCDEPAAPTRAHPAAAVHAADSCQSRQCCPRGWQIQRKGVSCSSIQQILALPTSYNLSGHAACIWYCNKPGVSPQHSNVKAASLQMGVGLASFSMKQAASFASVPFRVPIRAAQRQYFPIGRQLFLYPDIVTTSAPGGPLGQLIPRPCRCCMSLR